MIVDMRKASHTHMFQLQCITKKPASAVRKIFEYGSKFRNQRATRTVISGDAQFVRVEWVPLQVSCCLMTRNTRRRKKRLSVGMTQVAFSTTSILATLAHCVYNICWLSSTLP